MPKVVSKRSLAAVEDNKTGAKITHCNCTGTLHESGTRQRKVKRVNAWKRTYFECGFSHVRIQGRHEVKLISFCVRAKRSLKLSIPAMLVLVVYLIERWLINH